MNVFVISIMIFELLILSPKPNNKRLVFYSFFIKHFQVVNKYFKLAKTSAF